MKKPCAPKPTTVAQLLAEADAKKKKPVLHGPIPEGVHLLSAVAATPTGPLPACLIRPPAW